MLYVNDKELLYDHNGRDEDDNFKFVNPESKDNPNSIWVAECIEQIQKRKTNVITMCKTLRTLNSAATNSPDNLRAGKKVYDWPGNRGINITATIVRNGRSELWRWSERPRVQTRDGYDYYPNRTIPFGTQANSVPPTRRFQPAEAELIFFLEHVSPQKGEVFEFMDAAKTAKVSLDQKKVIALLTSILPDMPNSLGDDIIPELAEAYNIVGVDDILADHGKEGGLEILRDRLYEEVKNRFEDPADRKSIETFKSLVLGGERKLRAAVTKALDRRIIKLNQVAGESMSWFWSDGVKLCPIKTTNRKEDLFQWINKHEDDREKMLELLGSLGAVVSDKPDEGTEDGLDALSLTQLQNKWFEAYPEKKALPVRRDCSENPEWLKASIRKAKAA